MSKRTIDGITSVSKKQKGNDGTNDELDLIPKEQWPKELQELELIYFRFNSYFSFISTRNHILPTYDLMKPNIEKVLTRKLTLLDIAKLRVLLPQDIVFEYIDENQIYMIKEKFLKLKESGEFERKDVDMFKLKDLNQDRKQILMMELIDGNPFKSRLNENYKMGNLSNFNYNPEKLKQLIDRRNLKFLRAMSEFIKDCECKSIEPNEQLEKLAIIPEKIVHVDPIEAMKMNNQGLITNEERPKIVELIEEFKNDKLYKEQIVGEFVQDSKEAIYENLDFELPQEIEKILKIDQFYCHQAEALNYISKGHNVIVSTSTSSGKSLIYQLPAMKFIFDYLQLSNDLRNVPTAMYIFPTKALAQDQKRSLKELFNKVPDLKNIMVETFDGDTDPTTRKLVRQSAKVIFTNPDMLHANVLPNHQHWQNFLRNLKIIVIDELHTYRGLFGTHVALVIRRLRRICHYLGNFDVQFISCSATLKEPVNHMKQIFGLNENEKVYHVNKDGSPSGQKHIIAWNPPLIDFKNHERESFISETAKLLITLVSKNIKTICFCVVRRTVELIMKEVRHLIKNRPDLPTGIENLIMSYRGGYSIEDRREIEKEMFMGNLRAVIATNALELGIDIGVLDAVVICGFPISISNFHQQSGRAGRRMKDSLTLYVGAGDPINQYYMNQPNLLIEKNFQELVLDVQNPMVLEQHLQCASFEIPISIENDKWIFEFSNFKAVVKEKLLLDQYGYHTDPKYLPWPSKHVSLRGLEETVFAVVDITNNRNIIIEEIEASRTSFTLYEEGIMIHQGLPYIVREFNSDEHFAKVERVSVDWITKQRDFTDVDPMEIEKIKSQSKSDVPIYFGKIRTTITVFGFFKVDRKGKFLDSVDVKNPPVIIDSKGVWIDIPPLALSIIQSKQLNISAGIHAAEHAIMNVMPLIIISAIDEVQTECKAPEKELATRQTIRKRPARLVFNDSKGGPQGSGLCLKIFEKIDEILSRAWDIVINCDCEIGCPECVAGTYCKENSLVISKSAAIIILGMILGKKDFDWNLVANGPEENLPKIEIETIEEVKGLVKISDALEIVDVKQTEKEENMIKIED